MNCLNLLDVVKQHADTPGIRVYVYYAGKQALAPVYTQPSMLFTQQNPVIGRGVGTLPLIYVASGRYRIEIRDKFDVLIDEDSDLRAEHPSEAGAESWFKTLDSLLSDRFLSYDEQTGRRQVEPGARITVAEHGLSYTVAPEGAGDAHLTTAGGVSLYLGGAGTEDIRALDGHVDGSSDDVAAMMLSIAAQNALKLPRGVTYLDGTIQADDGINAWNGLHGSGHESVLRLGANARIKIQNQGRGGVLGTDHWPARMMADLTIDGAGQTAAYGVIVGTDTDLGETTITRTCNGAHFENVGIMDVGGPAWAVGYMTSNLWTKCYTKDCDYGWFFFTNTSDSASDIWTLNSCDVRSHDVAGLVALSTSPNAVSGVVTGGIIADNAGWGAFLSTTNAAARDAYVFQGTHFESNGTGNGETAAPVTVKDHGVALEPSHMYIERTSVQCTGCNFFSGYVQVVSQGSLTIEGGAIYTGLDGNSARVPPFWGSDESALIRLGGDVAFNHPASNTVAVTDYFGPVRITGTANDTLFLQSRIPKGIRRKAVSPLSADPSFESGTNGVSGGATPPTSVAATSDNPYRGTQALRVQFSASAGSGNTNSVLKSVGTIKGNAYVAVSFFAHAAADTELRVRMNVNEYGDNMGTPRVSLPGGEWVRIGILWRNRDATDVTGGLLLMFPQGTDAPLIDFDMLEIETGEMLDVLPVLQGYVGV